MMKKIKLNQLRKFISGVQMLLLTSGDGVKRDVKFAPFIAQGLGHLECRLKKSLTIGSQYFFIGEAVYAEADDTWFTDTWKPETPFIFHLGAKYFVRPGRIIKTE
jgi:flavin reductase (DIM6/NTAB) family NADH-FMN oxidoreductase RutF